VYVANIDPRLSSGEVRLSFEEMCGPVACIHQQLNNRRDTQAGPPYTTPLNTST